MNLAGIYRKYGTKILIIPITAFIVFTALAFFWPGITYGIDFRGGVMISFSSTHPIPAEKIAQKIRTELGVTDVSVTPTEIPGSNKYGAFVEAVYPERAVAEANVTATATLTQGESNASTSGTEAFKQKIIQIIKQ